MAQRTQARSAQSVIADMMAEEYIMEDMSMTPNVGGPTANMQGSPSDDNEGIQAAVIEIDETDNLNGDEEPEGFTAEELKIAKRFVELMGSADRAREALDKVDECMECLDIIDDEEPPIDDIEELAGMMPVLPDLPTGKNGVSLSNLYNPNATTGVM